MAYGIPCKHCNLTEINHNRRLNDCTGYEPKDPDFELQLYSIDKNNKNPGFKENKRLELLLKTQREKILELKKR